MFRNFTVTSYYPKAISYFLSPQTLSAALYVNFINIPHFSVHFLAFNSKLHFTVHSFYVTFLTTLPQRPTFFQLISLQFINSCTVLFNFAASSYHNLTAFYRTPPFLTYFFQRYCKALFSYNLFLQYPHFFNLHFRSAITLTPYFRSQPF